MNRYIRMLTEKRFRFSMLSKLGLYNWMSDEAYIRKRYAYELGHVLNLENPVTYNEKLQWLKLNDRRSVYASMVDKLEMKAFVEQRVGSGFVIPVIGGPWDSFADIDFERLPQQFVLKTTHDCGGVLVCKNKKEFDFVYARKFINKHLKSKYYLTCREWPYKQVKPRIFAEAYITDSKQMAETEQLTDYKFFCFDGIPKAMFVATDRADPTTETKFDFYDMNFRHLPIVQGHPNSEKELVKPVNYEQMKQIAAVLSKGIPQLRVDFYSTGDRLYVGELTLFHFGGFVPFEPAEWDKTFGDWIKLPGLE